MDIENFLLTIGKSNEINKENFIISDVVHCEDKKQRPVSICNIKYFDNDKNKYLLLELPFLKVIKKEESIIHLLIDDDAIKDELNQIDDVLFNLIDDIENRDDCVTEFNKSNMKELTYNTFIRTNEKISYIKIFYDKNTIFFNKDKLTDIFNVDINDMIQVILLIENIRIYTNENVAILKNLTNKLVIHKPVKIYQSPKINLLKINSVYNEETVFKKQVGRKL